MPDATAQRPDLNTYWVIPGKFLAGEYPRDKDLVKAREKINRCLEVGIRHFIDLTEFGELVPYADSIRRTYQDDSERSSRRKPNEAETGLKPTGSYTARRDSPRQRSSLREFLCRIWYLCWNLTSRALQPSKYSIYVSHLCFSGPYT